jgi:hypothetical protein
MLPVMHLIPRQSLPNELLFEMPDSYFANITFEDSKKEWVVETPGCSSYVGSLGLNSCTEKRVTMPCDGGSFVLRLSENVKPCPSFDRKCGCMLFWSFSVFSISHFSRFRVLWFFLP